MEFVIATFPQIRGLRVDGAPQGQTGQLIGVQRGHHIFDLGSPQDYVPASVPTVVAGTTQAQPMIIAFEPAVQPAGVVLAAVTRGAARVVPPAPEPAAVPRTEAMVRATKVAKKAARAKKEKTSAKKKGAKKKSAKKKSAKKKSK